MDSNSYKRKLIDYFKNNFKKGYTEEALKFALIKQGYSRLEINNALEIAHREIAESAPKIEEKPKIDYQIIDEYDNPITIKKPCWKRIFGL